jgi:hypothetical protein
VQQLLDLIFLWTHQFDACATLINSMDGLQNWRLTVDEWAIAIRLPIGAIPQLGAAVRQNLDRAFSTATSWDTDAAKDGTVFTPPPAAPKTAPAGGLTS